MSKHFFLIPDYNHPDTIGTVVQSCLVHGDDILIVDDGSDAYTKKRIAEAAALSDRVHVVALEQNSGKGAAVLAGFRWGIERGYTHAFQLDADAQQDATAIADFLSQSEANPQALICGYPVYDDQVPLSRKWGRRITDFWVMVNTLSLAYRDSLCGFRVYPLDRVARWLAKRPRVGLRMDFDCDILVQLYWDGIRVVNLPVRVFYPPDGISHFHAIENLYLSKMHARNFFGMLARLPKLLGRHFHA